MKHKGFIITGIKGNVPGRYGLLTVMEGDHMKKRITALAVTAAVFMCQLPPIDIIPDIINAAGEGTGASAELQTENAFSLKPGD